MRTSPRRAACWRTDDGRCVRPAPGHRGARAHAGHAARPAVGSARGWITTNEGPDTFSPFDNVGPPDSRRAHRLDPARAHHPGAGRQPPFEPYDRFAQVRESAGKTLESCSTSSHACAPRTSQTLRGWQLTEAQLALEGEHPELGPGHAAAVARHLGGARSRARGADLARDGQAVSPGRRARGGPTCRFSTGDPHAVTVQRLHRRPIAPLARELFLTMAAVFGCRGAAGRRLSRPAARARRLLRDRRVRRRSRRRRPDRPHAADDHDASASAIFIYDIAVVPAHQRQGVGRALVEALREMPAADGIDVVFVPADNDDTHALDFYRALGGDPAPVTIFTFGGAAD